MTDGMTDVINFPGKFCERNVNKNGQAIQWESLNIGITLTAIMIIINFLKAPIIFATYRSQIFPFDSMKSNKNLFYVNQ